MFFALCLAQGLAGNGKYANKFHVFLYILQEWLVDYSYLAYVPQKQELCKVS